MRFVGNALGTMRFACIAKLCTVASKLHSIYMNWEVGSEQVLLAACHAFNVLLH